MAADEKLVYTFLREAAEDEDFANRTDSGEVYSILRTLQRGKFETTTEDGTTLVSSSVQGKTFSFQVNAVLSPDRILQVAESAVQIVEMLRRSGEAEGATEVEIVAAIKAYRYPRRQRADFSRAV